MVMKARGYTFTHQLLTSIKRRIREERGPVDDAVEAYYRPYADELERARPRPSGEDLFLAESARSPVTLVGDFHTLDDAQRNYLHVLKALVTMKVRPIIVLEMAHASYDLPVHQFVREAITEPEFLERIRYFENWGFDFAHYRPIFEFARGLKLAVHGLDKAGELDARDRFMALRIKHLSARYPGQPILALVGDLHLAEPHLPLEMSRQGIEPLILFQNSESIYMRKLKRGREPCGWWKLSRRRFLWNTTSPAVKMQTYLSWLEHGGEAIYAMYGYCRWGETDGEIELADTVQQYISALHDLFGLRHRQDDDFQVFTFHSLHFLDDPWFKRGAGARYAAIVRDGRSLFTRWNKTLYVPVLDINQTVEESMHYLMDRDIPVEATHRAFMERVHYFASGYTASKLVNPTRTTPSPGDMAALVRRHPRIVSRKERKKLERQVRVFENVLAFLHLLGSRDAWRPEDVGPVLAADLETLYSVSRQVGYWLGDRLYRAYDAGRISGAELRRYAFQQTDPFYLLDDSDLEIAS